MIFVAAGTKDGRELALSLVSAGFSVVVSVVSQYGRELLEKCGEGLIINDKPLDGDGLAVYMARQQIEVFVDASHPYAAGVSKNAMLACRRLNIPYIRYERPRAKTLYDKVHLVADYEEAAKCAVSLAKNIFLTTGSRNLKNFCTSPYLAGCTVTVRVLPSAEVIAECLELGLSPGNIVAMEGPFSQKLNEELFKKYNAGVIVSKNSGQTGGTDTKIAAAAALNLPVVIIDRPKLDYTNVATTFDEVLEFVVACLKRKF